MIASLYFLTREGEVVIEKQYREQIPRVILDNFWTNSVASLPNGVSELATVVHYSRFAFIHVPVADVVVMAIATTEVAPMMVVEMLQTLVKVLQPYVKDFTEEAIRDQFSLVFQVLEEVLDHGFPLTTEPAILEELVQPPTLENRVRRLLDTPKKGAKQLDSLQVPWRTAGAQYSTNEILFDVIESLDVIVDSEGIVQRSDLRGVIECNCKLSGMPEIAVRLSQMDIFDDIAFHRCIRLSRYESDRTLAFVPPDGKFTLMQYRCKPTKVQPPIYVKPQITYHRDGGRINCIVGLRQGGVGLKEDEKNIHKLSVTIPLPKGTQSVNMTSCTAGTYSFEVDSHTLTWRIGALGTGTPSLSGEIVFKSAGTLLVDNSLAAQRERARDGTGESVSVEYQVPDISLSSIRVTSVEILNEGYKIFKGVKYIARAGKFYVRTV